LFATAAPGWAFTPVALAEIGPQIPFAVGSIPTGGYLLVWQDVRRSDFAVQAQRFTAAGQPQGPVKTLDVRPHSQLSPFSVAVGETGAWGVFWVEGAGADQIGIGGALFDAHDRLLKRLSYPDPVPDPGGLIISYRPKAVALPDGGFWLA